MSATPLLLPSSAGSKCATDGKIARPAMSATSVSKMQIMAVERTRLTSLPVYEP